MESKRIEYHNRIEYRNDQGELHRLDGPAIIYDNGNKFWYINNKCHREDGLPAVELSNGNKYWYINNESHREDGPAIEYFNGVKEWYLNGTGYTEDKYQTELIKIKLKRLVNENRRSI